MSKMLLSELWSKVIFRKLKGDQLKKTNNIAAISFSEDVFEHHIWGLEVSQKLYFADLSHNFQLIVDAQ